MHIFKNQGLCDMGKVVRLTTYKRTRKGNWIFRFSSTDLGSIMLLAQSTLAPENVFVKFFSDENSGSAFVDFLQLHDFYHPELDKL